MKNRTHLLKSMKRKNDLTRYYAVRDLIKTGDLIEWRSSGPVGRAIRFFTKRDVNHSSFVADIFRISSRERHKCILESLHRGIDINLLSDELLHYRGAVYWYPLKDDYDDKRDGLLNSALLYSSIKYDWKSLFLNALHRVKLDSRRLFCSEYYQQILLDNALIPVTSAVRPGDFERFKLHKPRVRIL